MTEGTGHRASIATALTLSLVLRLQEARKIRKMAPVFDNKEILVVFVLGGPGAGKGTQCAMLVAEYGFAHLSAGDLLRIEQQREGSEYAPIIQEHIKEGKIVPMEIVLKLMQESMKRSIENGHTKFLIDGFPREMEQAVKFDAEICESAFVLFLTCPEEKLLPRLIERGKTSGREDDNEESIKKRFQTFVQTSMPVIDHYSSKGKVVQVDSSGTVDQIYSDIKMALDSQLATRTSSHTAPATPAAILSAVVEEAVPDTRSLKPILPGETPKPRNLY
ncbi:hypothetical protein PSHT_11500 [Puccinia striiformis]|uniref:Uridylate kinase n=1 Tax=Puccinia striiformis TaxID=27350 RepID=A0A2S4V2Y5_9BASI|nr:hypothetical protein Pst134EB_020373 [Puccinia striiformis f. sp. tritici]POW03883.1 hypothetical protein PSHT_11500 [Puccinia striiformis]